MTTTSVDVATVVWDGVVAATVSGADGVVVAATPVACCVTCAAGAWLVHPADMMRAAARMRIQKRRDCIFQNFSGLLILFSICCGIPVCRKYPSLDGTNY
jgi:hypothetical protein